MIAAAIVVALFAPSQSNLSISRGAIVDGHPYQAVEDASLVGSDADANFGGASSLVGGPSRTILIKFGELDTLIPAGTRVKSARLRLTPVVGADPSLTGCRQVLVSWGEGPLRTFTDAFRAPGKPGDKSSAPLGSATWRERRAGKATWQRAGAAGEADSVAIEGLSEGMEGDTFVVSGLEAAVQRMAERPYENNGLALTFAANVEFNSSQSRTGRPVLEIETEAAPVKEADDLAVTEIRRDGADFVATVTNVGTAPGRAFRAVWIENDRAGVETNVGDTLAPGSSKEFRIAAPAPATGDPRFNSVELRLATNDADPRNDSLRIFPGGIWVTVAKPTDPAALQSLTRSWNDNVLAHSRFSFAPDGVLNRLNVTYGDGPAIPTDDRDAAFRGLALVMGLTPWMAYPEAPAPRFAGITGYGDTRYDGVVPGSIPLPYEPTDSPIFAVNPLEPQGLLPMTDVAHLNATEKTPVAMPGSVLIRATDIAGRPISNLKLDFYATEGGKAKSTPDFFLTTGATGTVVLPSGAENRPFRDMKPESGNAALEIRATANGITESSWLFGWMLLDAAARGNRAAATFELRFNLPGVLIDDSADLALNKTVTDSGSGLPAQLVALVDGDSATAAPLGGKLNDWIEVDLGRDRTISEILIAASDDMWSKFDIVGYGTGQRPTDAAPIAREVDWAWTRSQRAENGAVPYRGGSPKVRYIRIINRSTTPGKITGLKVFGARLGE